MELVDGSLISGDSASVNNVLGGAALVSIGFDGRGYQGLVLLYIKSVKAKSKMRN
jgi:hypothetical protein